MSASHTSSSSCVGRELEESEGVAYREGVAEVGGGRCHGDEKVKSHTSIWEYTEVVPASGWDSGGSRLDCPTDDLGVRDRSPTAWGAGDEASLNSAIDRGCSFVTDIAGTPEFIVEFNVPTSAEACSASSSPETTVPLALQSMCPSVTLRAQDRSLASPRFFS